MKTINRWQLVVEIAAVVASILAGITVTVWLMGG